MPPSVIFMMRNWAIAVVLTLTVAGCASVSHTIVGRVRPPINPGDVEVFRSAPPHYEEIALLDASSVGGFGHPSREGTNEAIYYMREEAAKLGANGVLLTGMGERYHGDVGIGVGGWGFSGGHSYVSGGGSVGIGGPITQAGIEGVAIYVPGRD
jgi:hypothetical protein